MRWRALITALVTSALVFLPTATVSAYAHTSGSDRQPHPSRSVPNRWHDSGHVSVWAGVPPKVRSIWLCIRLHESFHSGHWRAQNAVSTASGSGQWLNGTWDGLKMWVKVDGKFVARSYDEAFQAPPFVQDAAFVHVWRHDGLRMWRGTGCPGT